MKKPVLKAALLASLMLLLSSCALFWPGPRHLMATEENSNVMWYPRGELYVGSCWLTMDSYGKVQDEGIRVWTLRQQPLWGSGGDCVKDTTYYVVNGSTLEYLDSLTEEQVPLAAIQVVLLNGTNFTTFSFNLWLDVPVFRIYYQRVGEPVTPLVTISVTSKDLVVSGD